MTTAGREIRTATPQTSQGKNLGLDRITELTRTLALVRPVGMGDDMASDWIAAACAETIDMSDAMFASGCQDARRECSHHGQIVPTIRKAQASLETYRRQLDALSWATACHEAPAKQIGHRGEVRRIGTIAERLTWDGE